MSKDNLIIWWVKWKRIKRNIIHYFDNKWYLHICFYLTGGSRLQFVLTGRSTLTLFLRWKNFAQKNRTKICHFCNVNSRSIKFAMSTIHFVLLFLGISQSFCAIVEELDSSEVLNSHVVPYHSDKLQCEFYNATCFSEGLDPKSCQGMFKGLYGHW